MPPRLTFPPPPSSLPPGTADPLPPLAWVDVVAERAAGLDPELPLLLIIDDLTTLAGSSPPADVAQFLFRAGPPLALQLAGVWPSPQTWVGAGGWLGARPE